MDEAGRCYQPNSLRLRGGARELTLDRLEGWTFRAMRASAGTGVATLDHGAGLVPGGGLAELREQRDQAPGRGDQHYEGEYQPEGRVAQTVSRSLHLCCESCHKRTLISSGVDS